MRGVAARNPRASPGLFQALPRLSPLPGTTAWTTCTRRVRGWGCGRALRGGRPAPRRPRRIRPGSDPYRPPPPPPPRRQATQRDAAFQLNPEWCVRGRWRAGRAGGARASDASLTQRAACARPRRRSTPRTAAVVRTASRGRAGGAARPGRRPGAAGRATARPRPSELSEAHGGRPSLSRSDPDPAPVSDPLPPPTPPRHETPGPPNTRHADSPAAFDAALSSPRLVVAEFFVPWCPGCRAMLSKLHAIAANNPDVDFVMVNGAAPGMADLARGEGVERLPGFALYRSRARISAFSVNLTRIAVLRAEIAANKDCLGECALHDEKA